MEEDHSEAVQQFCAITGAEAYEAEHMLEAYSFHVERAINAWMENGGRPTAMAGADSPPAQARQEGPVDLARDFSFEVPGRQAGLGQGQAHAFIDDDEPVDLGEDDDLQRALAASMREAGVAGAPPPRPAAARPSQPRVEFPDDDEDEDLAVLARQRAQAQAAARHTDDDMEEVFNRTRRVMEEMLAGAPPPVMFPGLGGAQPGGRAGGRPPLSVSGVGARSGGAAAPSAAGGPRGAAGGSRRSSGRASSGSGGAGAVAGGSGAAAAARGAGASSGPGPLGLDDDDVMAHMPDGMMSERELEEARMIEAAMLGIPYEGRIPDFTNRPGPSVPTDPSVREHRSLRWEQDQAYEESLAADRAKAESAERARRGAEEAERAAAEAAAAEARRLQEAERALQQALATKEARLPEEPAAGTEGSINVVIRMPDGSRTSRRFRRTDPLQALFDFVDVKHQGAGVKPGGYNLVNSFPRKAFADGTPGSLEGAGITTDSALFLEPTSK